MIIALLLASVLMGGVDSCPPDVDDCMTVTGTPIPGWRGVPTPLPPIPIPFPIPTDLPEAPEAEEEDGLRDPACKTKDRLVDERAKLAASQFRPLCFHNDGQSGYEHARLIYRDGSVGGSCVGDDQGVPQTNSVYIDRCLIQDRQSGLSGNALDVVAILHCGESLSEEDIALVNNLHAEMTSIGYFSSARDLRGYLVTEDGIQEHRADNPSDPERSAENQECNNDEE